MAFEEDEPPRRFPPLFDAQSSSKKRIRGLSMSSESQFDPEIKKKIIHVARPARANKSTPKKGKETDSESEASQDDEPVSRPARKNLVRVLLQATPSKPSVPRSVGHRARHRFPPGPVTPSKPFGPLDDSDSDEFPVVLAPFSQSQKIIKAVRTPASDPPKKQSAVKSKPSLRRAATPTPPSSPLSAPLTPSPKAVKRIPTAAFSVLVPNVKDTVSFSAPAKKAPPGRTHSVSVLSHHRASPASAPPRSRRTNAAPTTTSSPSASSRSVSISASSVAAPEVGGRAKRSAAEKATQRLHETIMPDVVNFENEMRNRGRKSRRVSVRTETEDDQNGDEEEDERPSTKRRKLDGGKRGRASTSGDESVFEQPAKPKPRKSEVVQRNGKPIKLMTTGQGSELSDEVLKALAKLGAKVTNRATECTHLIVAGLVRTEKFLCALTGAPFILTRDWAVDSAAAGELMGNGRGYLLQDDAGDAKYNFSLSRAVSRAKTLKGKLFQDHTFYITPKVTATTILRNVILANGGQTITTSQPSLRILETTPIVIKELVLTCALRQEVDWDDASFRVPGSQ
ncbi:hypothetical protein B0H13DRAFT_2304926 [Mycena leptocephala]|nr:hypothetical protein B0H13DRAFT_2304926 [Mycena leptocephala]